MMSTRSLGRSSGQLPDAGSFANFDLSRVPSPCFVVDEVAIRRNLEVLKSVSERSNVRVLLALKAFSMWSLAPLINDYLAGSCASSLWEARLAHRYYTGTLASYAPAFRAGELDEIAALSSYMIFNNLAQIERFGAGARTAGAEIGLRINPQHSEGSIAKYDPCAAGSRLGQPVSQLLQKLPDYLSGLHMHTLCEQGFAPLKRTVDAVWPFLSAQSDRLAWLNLGGGHLVTHPDYDRDALVHLLCDMAETLGVQTYLELGAAVALDAGVLVGEVLDVADNDGPVAVLDISAACHMPDVLEAPYRPALLGEPDHGVLVTLGGPSCLAGDIMGQYQFTDLPMAGQRIAFLDQAHYSMVKTTTFNGIGLPTIAIWNSETDVLRLVKSFDYDDFKRRLS